ncbi:hypothetical protein LCGC14_1102150 [marine sediment metagenome]|uniref:Uncharacterized protein n=1 Tax=marine sediment metagenome TaxID=412755 RepID=A0A0F9PSE9_9ZZZZ
MAIRDNIQVFRGEDRTLRFSVIDANIQTKVRDGGDGIDEVQTTISVVSTAGFASSGRGKLDDEIFSYTGITTTSFTGVARGAAQVFGAIFGATPHNEGTIIYAVPDVTGWTTELDVRETGATAASIITDKVGSSPSVVNGLIDISIVNADTEAQTPDTYVYGFTRIDTGSNTVLAHGAFVISQEVTR